MPPLTIVEIRDYDIQGFQRDAFIDFFEHQFIGTQQAAGMHVLGQFRSIGAANRFVWLRGFPDMATRLASLTEFYSSPFWKKMRNPTNAMLIDSDRVHLLRSITPVADLTNGRSADLVATELAEGTISPRVGIVAIDFYQTDPEATERQAEPLANAYRDAGIAVRGVLAAERGENDYPRLPVLHQPGALVVISAYPNEEGYRGRALPTIDPALHALHDPLVLVPTLRSPLRGT